MYSVVNATNRCSAKKELGMAIKSIMPIVVLQIGKTNKTNQGNSVKERDHYEMANFKAAKTIERALKQTILSLKLMVYYLYVGKDKNGKKCMRWNNHMTNRVADIDKFLYDWTNSLKSLRA